VEISTQMSFTRVLQRTPILVGDSPASAGATRYDAMLGLARSRSVSQRLAGWTNHFILPATMSSSFPFLFQSGRGEAIISTRLQRALLAFAESLSSDKLLFSSRFSDVYETASFAR